MVLVFVDKGVWHQKHRPCCDSWSQAFQGRPDLTGRDRMGTPEDRGARINLGITQGNCQTVPPPRDAHMEVDFVDLGRLVLVG